MIITCKFGSSCDKKVIGESSYQCKVHEGCDLEVYGAKIAKFHGQHREGKAHKDVDDILFKDSPNILYFPNGLSDHFPNLVALNMKNCGLKAITKRDLLGLENLKYLTIEGCQLKTLPSDLFENMKKLKIISFKNNKLKYLTRKVFENVIENTREIDLRQNSKYCYYGIESLHYTGKGSPEMFFQSVDSNFEAPLNDNVLERHNEKMLNAINDLWTTKKYSDFTIVVENKRFPVHKSVLSAESSVFATVFDTDMMEKQNGELIIEDFIPESVEEFLEYIYTGHLPDDTNAMDLFALSHKYDVQNFKNYLEKIIIDNIEKPNAFEVFLLGHLHDSKKMKNIAFNFIKQKIFTKPMPESLMNEPENLKKLLDADEARRIKIIEAEKDFATVYSETTKSESLTKRIKK